MSENKSTYESTVQTLSVSGSPGDIILGLQTLRELLDTGEISEKQRLEAQLIAFRSLRNLRLENQRPDIITNVFIDYLLQDSLLDDSENRDIIYRHREVFGKWLEELDMPTRNLIREKVLEIIIPLIESDSSRSLFSVISRLGFRDETITNVLWNVVRRSDNETSDFALSTLVWLGFTIQERNNLLRELHSRIEKRYNNHLLWAIARIGDNTSLPKIINAWLSTKTKIEGIDPSLVFTGIREILDGYENELDHELQDITWIECKKIVEKNPKAHYWEFDIGHITTICNSPLVIPTYLRWQGQHPDWFENPAWARYLSQDRLEKCIKPRQLQGWSKIDGSEIFELLKMDACKDSNYDGFVTNQEVLAKESAWETLLRAGYEEALNWFENAVMDEKGRFVREKVMNLFSCFVIDPLPESVIQLIIDRYDHPGESDSREFSFRMAAVRMARSAATRHALDILLSFGFTYKGKVINQSTDAISEVALHLVRKGDTTIVDQLTNIVIKHVNHAQRLAAANAIEVISAEASPLLEPYVDQLVHLLYDENREQIEKGLILYGISNLKDWRIPEKLLLDLIRWSHQPDRWVGGGSLAVLANQGYLEQDPELMHKTLGLRFENNQWFLDIVDLKFDWAPFTIGSLYNRNPQLFIPAIVSMLRQCDWQDTTQLVRWLALTHGREGNTELPYEVLEGLFDRILRTQSSFYTETDIFDLLSVLSPDAIASYPWERIIINWMPDAKVALGNALGKSKISQSVLKDCLATLEFLSGDSLYPVRRAAFRGIALQSTDYMYTLCRSWSESSILDLNKRAAEAVGWVENVVLEENRDGFTVLYNELISHPESTVREAAKRSWNERRRRIWSREYLEKILEINEASNREILNLWCYGDALKQVGDDDCARILRGQLTTEMIPPNIRYWYKRILNDLEKNWQKTTKEWPDPWTDMAGAIERGLGKISLDYKKEFDVQYNLWKQPATLPKEKHSWGGTIISSTENLFGLRETTLELVDGRKGKIIFSEIRGDSASFLGTGPYPEVET